MIKYIIPVVSDLHINSTVGLSVSEYQLDDGTTYRASKSQAWLLSNWRTYWSKILDLKKDNREAKVITIVNGDVVDLNKHSAIQMISVNPKDVFGHAKKLLEFPVRFSDKTFFTRGTEAHSGDGHYLETILAEHLNVPITQRLKLDIAGNLLVFNHHGSVGTKPWTKTNSLNSKIVEIMYNAQINNEKLPKLVVQSHVHTYADTYDTHPVRLIQTPCWQLNTHYSYRMNFTNSPDIGAIIILINDSNEIEVLKLLFKTEEEVIYFA